MRLPICLPSSRGIPAHWTAEGASRLVSDKSQELRLNPQLGSRDLFEVVQVLPGILDRSI